MPLRPVNTTWKAYKILVARRRFKSRLILEAYDQWIASGRKGGIKGLDRRFAKVRKLYALHHERNKRL